MKMFLRSGLVAAAAVGLMASSASAGTLAINAQDVALEALGTERDVPLGAPNEVAYTLGQNLTSSNLVRVTWGSGLAFAAGTYLICATDGANEVAIGEASLTANDTSQDFQIDITGVNAANVAAGEDIYLAGNNCFDAGNVAEARVLSASASEGEKTLEMAVLTSGGLEIDSADATAAANVTEEFGATVTTLDSTIDYLGGASNDGTLFETTNTVANNGIALVLNTGTVDYSAVGDAGLTVSALINFSSDTNWTGVDTVWATTDAANACSTSAANNQSNVVTDPSGEEILTLTAAAFNGTGNNNVRICMEVDGETALASRTIAGSYDIEVSTGGVDPTAVNATWQEWAPNGWQGRVPHMRYGATNRTFVRIVNGGTTPGQVFVDVTEPDGDTLTRASLGTLGAGETATYSASDIATSVGTSNTDFDALFTVTADPDSIYANSFMNLQSGGVWTTRDNTLYEFINFTTNAEQKQK
ncbi:MAG: hypothetical protein C4519_18345 [Desulfobacteraceae bacterium]|nr:MAG: hypothetical protein C4519_18345 [Desulfobacteraceae bacterium]